MKELVPSRRDPAKDLSLLLHLRAPVQVPLALAPPTHVVMRPIFPACVPRASVDEQKRDRGWSDPEMREPWPIVSVWFVQFLLHFDRQARTLR